MPADKDVERNILRCGDVPLHVMEQLPTDKSVDATRTVAEFVRKGMAAQQAVDEILAAYAAGKSRND